MWFVALLTLSSPQPIPLGQQYCQFLSGAAVGDFAVETLIMRKCGGLLNVTT